MKHLIQLPHGIVLVTGPTGSGKTTTLYSALNQANDVGVKIITTEDPVEYELDGIMQIQVERPSIGVTYASCLRAILRQDPDMILVGEIRDLETAQIAVEAALTGHVVFSHAPHERRRPGRAAHARPRRGGLPRRRHRRGDARAAARAHDLQQLQGPVRARPPRC